MDPEHGLPKDVDEWLTEITYWETKAYRRGAIAAFGWGVLIGGVGLVVALYLMRAVLLVPRFGG